MNEILKIVEESDTINEKTINILQDDTIIDGAKSEKAEYGFEEAKTTLESDIVNDKVTLNDYVFNDETNNQSLSICNKEAENFSEDNINIKITENDVENEDLKNNIFIEKKTTDIEETQNNLSDDDTIKTKIQASIDLVEDESNLNNNTESEKKEYGNESNIKENDDDAKNLKKDKSDDEDDNNFEKNDVGDLMTNIFGDESDEEDEPKNVKIFILNIFTSKNFIF